MLPEIISKIYVINLEHCKERKEHIIDEFKNNNIENYEFFTAVNKDSEQVKNMMNSNFIAHFPPCFRCKQNTCNCNNNYLMDSQIGNWCSFINLMKKIQKEEHNELIMISEDDIKFTKNGLENINKVISRENFKQKNIDKEKPILIRLAKAYRVEHHDEVYEPYLDKKIFMSNPCFLINRLFAEIFLENLNKIDTTSDIYIHYRLPYHNKVIQDYTVMPVPIYELSTSRLRKFSSEIKYKGNKLRKDSDE